MAQLSNKERVEAGSILVLLFVVTPLVFWGMNKLFSLPQYGSRKICVSSINYYIDQSGPVGSSIDTGTPDINEARKIAGNNSIFHKQTCHVERFKYEQNSASQ